MTGFYEQRQKLSPTGLAVVIAMHAAALGALAFLKGPDIFRPPGPMQLIDIRVPPATKQEPPPPPVEASVQPPMSRIDQPEIAIQMPPRGPVVASEDLPPVPPPTGVIGTGGSGALADIPALPVRVAAMLDSRDLQPPYPAAEQRAERDGTVRIRVTIGGDGRVKAVERISATSDAFWRATERHALARWRFRPATEDGRPVESSKVMTVYFRIEA